MTNPSLFLVLMAVDWASGQGQLQVQQAYPSFPLQQSRNSERAVRMKQKSMPDDRLNKVLRYTNKALDEHNSTRSFNDYFAICNQIFEALQNEEGGTWTCIAGAPESFSHNTHWFTNWYAHFTLDDQHRFIIYKGAQAIPLKPCKNECGTQEAKVKELEELGATKDEKISELERENKALEKEKNTAIRESSGLKQQQSRNSERAVRMKQKSMPDDRLNKVLRYTNKALDEHNSTRSFNDYFAICNQIFEALQNEEGGTWTCIAGAPESFSHNTHWFTNWYAHFTLDDQHRFIIYKGAQAIPLKPCKNECGTQEAKVKELEELGATKDEKISELERENKALEKEKNTAIRESSGLKQELADLKLELKTMNLEQLTEGVSAAQARREAEEARLQAVVAQRKAAEASQKNAEFRSFQN
ncbi:unnamed protein product [Cyprideis torosa]|uniref:Uncharacterized protein n=1 Tax=Cyprideis torosa TaxID=163714 RepID=A0A7R8WL89_9CRUS|nr:unnamed protein product [Cyprideis torosa]CAG0904090.1 unnamed protein product [Cyprideis torosa]